nr:transposase [Paracoccus versutus]
MIRKMYAVEKAARGLPPDVRRAMRQERTLPVLAEIWAELVKAEPGAQGTLKKAVNYALKAFDALQRFAFDGRLEIDNNPVERCIRGIALTKKNSLFAGNHEAAEVWAI